MRAATASRSVCRRLPAARHAHAPRRPSCPPQSWRPGGPGRQSLGQYGFTSVVKLSCPFLKSTVYKKVDVSVYTRRDFSYWYPMATLFY